MEQLRRTRCNRLAPIMVLGVIAACESSKPTDVPRQESVIKSTLIQEGSRRDDTPWRRMTGAELSAKVAEAGGRVFIGFKNPEASAGVDEAGRVLVSPANVAAAKTMLRGLGLDFEIEFVDMPTVVTRIGSAFVPQLRADPLIEYIEPIFPGTYSQQITTWNVQRVNAPLAWSSSTGAGAKLLITDSGIDNAHPDLAPAVVQTCVPYPDDGLDVLGHGTAVIGIAAAVNNAVQVVGVAHGVALWSSKIGSFAPDPGYAACAIQFGRVNNVHVISMSVSLQAYTALTDQINAAYNQDGIVIVVGAGNTDGGAVTYPATLASAIAVSATDTTSNFGPFSAAGPKVELAAPGTTVTDQRGLTSTCLGGTSASSCGFGLVQGTSFAAPHVAAAAAILRAYNPSWTNEVVRDRLQQTAVDLGPTGRDNQFGFGLINIRAALDFTPPPPPPPPPPPAPSVSISGPTAVQPFSQCLYQALASGGTLPYSYAWKADGTPVGSDDPFYRHNAGTTSFLLEVTVTDAANASGGNLLSVAVSPSAPECLDSR
jgi:subtilisin family serine protease